MSTNRPDSTWNRTTAAGIPYKLVRQSGGIQEYQTSAREEIIIQADKLAAFGAECFPAPLILLGRVFYPSRRRFPGLPHLQVVNLSWGAMDDGKPLDPFMGGVAPTYYEHVKVMLDYEPVPFDNTENPNDPLTFLQISANVAASFIHNELRGAYAEDDSEIMNPDVPHTILEVLTEWTLRWPMIPTNWFDNVLMSRMRERVGHVNSSASRLWKNAPAETILFVGFDFSTERQWSPEEGETRAPTNCTMKFLEKNFKSEGKQITHNHFWVPGKKGSDDPPLGWQKVRLGKNPNKYTYETADLDAIFTG